MQIVNLDAHHDSKYYIDKVNNIRKSCIQKVIQCDEKITGGASNGHTYKSLKECSKHLTER